VSKRFQIFAIFPILLGPLSFSSAQNPAQPQAAKVEVKVVNYDGLKDAVKDLKGKLVVVDFWSTT
jgi:hypothetical protein